VTLPTYQLDLLRQHRINVLIRAFAVMTFILMSAHVVMATTVTAVWASNTEPDIAGYTLSYGTQSGTYTTSIDVGNVTSRVLDLPAGHRYYFVVQAYNTSAQISARSAPEAIIDLTGSSASVISSLSPATGPVGTSVTVSGANFGATQGTSVVRFNGTVAVPSSWSSTRIVAPVPANATTGPVVVTVGGVASNGLTFAVGPSGTLPAPWLDQDVGAPVVTGSATLTSGTFSVTGSGADIWDASDQFHFVYQPLNGDGEIVVRVATLQHIDGWTKAGVMIRQDLTGNAPNAFMLVSAGHGLSFQQRATRGAQSTFIQGPAGVAPQWVRLVRSGTTLTGYSSSDGTTWTARGSFTITLPTQVYIGLAVTSHNTTATATGTFSNVTVTGPGGAVTSMAQPANPGAATVAPLTSTTGSPSAEPATTLSASRNLPRMDYDGDGKADIAVYRPSTGEWRILTSGTNYAESLVVWGMSTDVPVPGDYDGDRKTDIAFYRASTGTWSILKSSAHYRSSVEVVLGSDADVPVPGDYDGDGVTDVAVYNVRTGGWHVLKSSSSYAAESVITGSPGRPVPADYDGDGKADPAVYDSVTGEWRILQSSTDYATTLTIVLGASGGDVPVPGDYDGDGVTDIAIFKPGSGVWQVLLSSRDFKTGITSMPGGATDIPVPGDYDGDGKDDFALFRAGAWQIPFSSLNGMFGVIISSGLESDVPLPRLP
jgi:hypothetical protein